MSLYDKECTCLICELTFKTKKVELKDVKVASTDTDLYQEFKGLNPYFYEINVCPNCGFSFSDKYVYRFNQAKTDNFINLFAPRWNKRDYSGERDITQAIETYKLALICGGIAELRQSNIARLCLKLSWLSRIAGEKDEEKKYLKGACNLLNDSYENEDLSKGEDIDCETVIYLLGELNFRLENYEDAKKWFNVGITKYINKPDANKRVVEMLRDRWQEIKPKLL